MEYTAIEAARKAAKMSKTELAKAVGMASRRLGDILKGRIDPRVSELEAIAAYLKLTLAIQKDAPQGTRIEITRYSEDGKQIDVLHAFTVK